MGAPASTLEPVRTPPSRLPRRDRPNRRSLGLGCVGAIIGGACGVSPFFGGFYDLGIWGPIALGLFAAVLGALIATRQAVPTGVAAVAIGSLALLAGWALLSQLWAESADTALVASGRIALYAAAFAVFVTVFRRQWVGLVVLSAGAAGALIVAAYVVVRMLDGDTGVFLEGRLNEPMGYVNGEAGLFLVVSWLLLAVAERARRAWVAGLAASGVGVLGSLIVLSQSRGAALGAAVAAVIVLAVVPGRLRRLALLIGVGAILGLLGGPLREVYSSSGGGAGSPTADAVRDGGIQVLVIGAVLGVGWGLAVGGLAALIGSNGTRRRTARRVATTLVGCLVLILAIGGIAFSGRIADRASKQWDNFVSLEGEGSGQRLFSGGGDRYDFWRIALNEARDHPLVGVGAGNYDRDYYVQRRTLQPITQPHSLPLQLLSELGAIGLGLFVAFVVAICVGLVRRARAARMDRGALLVTIAAAGAFLSWLAESCVDWLPLIPGLTALALCGGALLVLPARGESTLRRMSTPRRPLLTGAVVVLVGFAAFTVGRIALAQHEQNRAQAALASDPAKALSSANRALDYEPELLPALYVKAVALARINRYADARAVLFQAIHREPHNFAPWQVLGDVATRRGDLSLARTAYRRALALNPRDPTLQRLAGAP